MNALSTERKRMPNRVLPTPAVPMGMKIDPEATLTENAKAAWNRRKEIAGIQGEHGARVLGRRVFGREDFEFSRLSLYPLMPTFVIDDELIGYDEGSFSLLELCSECGKHVKHYQFDSLAGFGAALERREGEDPFVCQTDKLAAALRESRR